MANENNNFEAALFKTADKLRKNIDAAEKVLDEQIKEQLAKIGFAL